MDAHIAGRLKKIKCGEERPHCARCVRYGSKCTYPRDVEVTRGGSFSTFAVKPITPPRKGQSHETGHRTVFWQDTTIRSCESPVSSSPTSDQSSSQEADTNSKLFPIYKYRIPIPTKTTLPLVIPGTQAERHLFHYLRIRVLPDTGGSSNHNFWRVAVLSLCHQNSVVRSAALSLGSFYLAKHSENSSDGLKALKQYHFALQAARNYLSNRTEPFDGPLLIICLLFYTIETARGEYEAASNHVLAGLRVLRSWNHNDRTSDISKSKRLGEFNDISIRLAGLFSSLDANMHNGSNLTPPNLVMTSLDERSGLKSCIPMPITGHADAARSFGKLNNWHHHFLASIASISPPVSLDRLPIPVSNELSYLMENMERWETSSDHLILPNQSWKQIADTTCLKVLCLRNKILFHSTLASLTSSPMLIDVNQDFNRLLDMVSMTTDAMAGSPERIEVIKPSLFMSCILAPLTLVGITCRSNEMRKRAVRLLKLWPVEEGIYDGKKFARAFEMAMDVSRQVDLEKDEDTQLRLFRAAFINFLKQETGICLPPSSVFTFPA
ncbi:hypothetical protein HYALB_00010327 [Hymenoscyphus albidus]|uniref:Zn(2)-C6 fungal-type domain-containing protein n=1 Tax=Hymenoscyphus albidus TaxID=595503 RepID=A0A9N9LMZ8_9HELO|nr:hypothetical protein HYALB_00010327 [Hymenoscyphus albidus]